VLLAPPTATMTMTSRSHPAIATSFRHRFWLLWGFWLLLWPALLAGQQQSLIAPNLTPEDTPVNLPAAVKNLKFDQKLGQQVTLSLPFVDHDGRQVALGDYFGERPVLLAPVYFECPMLCSLVLDGIVRGAQPLPFLPARDFEIVALGFDPDETPENAAVSRNAMLARYGRAGTEDGWHFLTGEQDAIAQLMDEVGFRYEYDAERDVYNHVGGIILLTPEGQVSRYLLGVDFAPKDLRFGMIEASENKIGSLVDQVLLYCYQYDPETGKYSVVAMNVIRIAGVLTVLSLAFFIIASLRWERSRRQRTVNV
jgi:protein SCO1/2